MKANVSSLAYPEGRIFGFVIHNEYEIPRVPLMNLADYDRKHLEILRDLLNEVLEW